MSKEHTPPSPQEPDDIDSWSWRWLVSLWSYILAVVVFSLIHAYKEGGSLHDQLSHLLLYLLNSVTYWFIITLPAIAARLYHKPHFEVGMSLQLTLLGGVLYAIGCELLHLSLSPLLIICAINAYKIARSPRGLRSVGIPLPVGHEAR